MATETDTDQIEKLIDGELSWEELRSDVLPDPKDPNRFGVTREILQERVDFDEEILVPINDHIFAVDSEGDRVFKSECGHEFGPVEGNWKEHCQVRVRESMAEMRELYPENMTPDPDWTFQLREFFCPECYTLLDVDAVPAGYPVLKPFDPDIDTFYEEWLDKPTPDTA
jgi:acetone carboxylase gamma subunit